MATEIERKFLVSLPEWDKVPKPAGLFLLQGYLVNEPGRTLRVRIAGDEAFLTLKGPQEGITRSEYEYPIPIKDAEELLVLYGAATLSKIRYRMPFEGRVWEVDVFHGLNEGLIVAEIELEREDEAFVKPPWVAMEVSGDPRYLNSNLVKVPFTRFSHH